MSISSDSIGVWKLDCLKGLLDDFDSTVSKTVAIRDIKLDYDLTNVVLFSAGKSIVTLQEIITLCFNGYPDGALSLARNLYEQFIILYFFFKNQNSNKLQEYLKDYYTNYEIQRQKIQLEYYKVENNADAIQKTQDRLTRLKDSITKNTKGDYWWADANNFKDLKDKVSQLETDENSRIIVEHMHLVYRRSSVSIHANCLGNMNRLCNDADFWGVDTSPKYKCLSMPLWLATISFQFVVKAVCDELHIEDYYSNKLFELSLLYCKKMKTEFNYD